MIKLSIWRSQAGQKSMCLTAHGRLQGRAARLLFARRKLWCNESLMHLCLTANGTAIWGGCVTRRKHRMGPGTLAGKQSRCKEGMARVFALHVGSWLSRLWIAVQISQGSVSNQVIRKVSREQCAPGQSPVTFLSW